MNPTTLQPTIVRTIYFRKSNSNFLIWERGHSKETVPCYGVYYSSSSDVNEAHSQTVFNWTITWSSSIDVLLTPGCIPACSFWILFVPLFLNKVSSHFIINHPESGFA